MNTKDYNIINPSLEEFSLIKDYIKAFELDGRELNHQQFLMAKTDEHVLGFGRIKKMDSYSELCSLGTIESHRLKGIGKKLVQSLISISDQPLYLVCIIPDFFIPLGFVVVSEYPNSLNEKLNYCTNELIVKEKYVVMKYLCYQNTSMNNANIDKPYDN